MLRIMLPAGWEKMGRAHTGEGYGGDCSISAAGRGGTQCWCRDALSPEVGAEPFGMDQAPTHLKGKVWAELIHSYSWSVLQY